MPLISIIIPVYDASGYLRQCLGSIVDQDFADWECLLIDDGSNDGSAEICDEFADKNGRFIVFHQMNQGVSAARNIGLEHAHGKYICFVDSDDWLDECFLETMASAINDSDWVISGQSRVSPDGSRVTLAPDASGTFSITRENSDTILELERKLLFFAVHEKLYRKDIIREKGIRFPEGCSYGEDLIFNYSYLEHVQTFSTIAEALYNYRMHEGSLSRVFRPEQFNEDYAQWLIIKEFHERRAIWNDDVEAYLAKRLWGIVYDGLFLYPWLEDKDKGYLSRILSIPEIDLLNKYRDTFDCAGWIKRSVISHLPVAFRLYFRFSYGHAF